MVGCPSSNSSPQATRSSPDCGSSECTPGAHRRMPEATGRHGDVEQIWIFTIADDQIIEIRGVSDRLSMFLQLGWDWPT